MYRIVIEEIDQVTRMDKEYQRVADTGNSRDNGPIYEYVPIERTKIRERKVYEQLVDTLNLAAVICAVNERPLMVETTP